MAYITTNHEEIRSWIEKQGGTPAIVRGTTSNDSFGVLHIDFNQDPNLEPISWNVFFDRFESAGMAFSYDDDRRGLPHKKFTFLRRADISQKMEDTTTLPDAGDQKRAEENMYNSADDNEVGLQQEWQNPNQ